MKQTALALALAIALAGCAYNRPEFTEHTTGTNGAVTVRKLAVPTWALWPATSALNSQRATLGKTFSLGTTELAQDGGGSNVVEALRSIEKITSRIP